MARRTSPTCRQLTGTLADRIRLEQVYDLSQHFEHENAQAICRTGKNLFLLPWPAKSEKWREWGEGVVGRARALMRPEYEEMITFIEDDPCKKAKAELAGSIHTHPSGEATFSFADLEVEAPERKQCLLYRKKKDVRLKCMDLKTKEYVAPENVVLPEKQDPNLLKHFTKACDIRIAKGKKKAPRLRLVRTY